MRCPRCGHETGPPARFCATCGAALGPQAEGETRPITVLFADLSGSVRRVAATDAETAAEMLDRVLEVMVAAVKRYGGTVRQLLGDGVLAYFGTPMAHENDPERAILAALEIREGLRALGLASTAGINSGEVYVGAVGSEAHTESSAVGTPVNIAARLQAKALPGQVLVGPSTHAHARDAFAFIARDLEVKGFDQSLKAYEVVTPQKRPEAAKGIPGLRAQISGRARELARLESALHELVGGRGSVISLEGEAGVGKSRLIEEFRALARHQRVEITWVEGHCFDLGHTVSYSCFLDLFRDLLGFANVEGTYARAELVRTLVSDLVSARRIATDRAGEIEAVLAELLSARVAEEEPPWLAGTDALRLKEITFLAVREVLQALAFNGPLVVALEDVHWADSLSIDLVSSLFEVVRLAPVLLLYSYRRDADNEANELPTQAEAACPGRHARLALRHLTSEESAALISSLLAHSADLGPLIELIFERAQGNPFFIEEIVRSLIDSGELLQDGSVWRTRGGQLPTIPESVQNVIRSRVDRTTPEAREVLRVASVVGRDFDARLIDRVMGIEGRLPELLDQLEHRALIDRIGSRPGYSYSFRHALTQATVYGSMLRRRRTVVHKQVGEAMEVIYDELEAKYEELAHHFVAAGVTDKAVDYLLKAGIKAARNYLNELAEARLRQALSLLPDPADAPASRLWWALGRVESVTGRFEQARASFNRALTTLPAGAQVDRALLYDEVADAWLAQRRADEAAAALDLADTALGREPPGDSSAWWHAWFAVQGGRMQVLYFAGRPDEMAPLAERLREAAQRHGTPNEQLKVLSEIILSTMRRDSFVISDQTLADARFYWESAVAIGERRTMANARFQVAFALLWHDDVVEAAEVLVDVMEHFEPIGDAFLSLLCTTYLAVVRRRLGHLGETRRLATSAFALAQQQGVPMYLGAAEGNLAWVELREGNVHEAEIHASAALHHWSEDGSEYPFKWLALAPLLEIAVTQARYDAAKELARSLLEPAQRRFSPAIDAALRAYEQPGHLEAAVTLMREAGYL